MNPRVSIIVPTRNRSKYLIQAVESVLSQSETNWEIIIIDDNSTDDTHEVVQKYLKDGRIRYVKHSRGKGLSGIRNEGVSLAKSEYVMMLDDDDFWNDKDKIKKEVDFLDKNLDFALVGTQGICVDPSSKPTGKTLVFEKADRDIRQTMLKRNQFAQSSVAFRKTMVVGVGGYDEQIEIWEDYDLWLRLGEKFKFANLGDFTLCYRVHSGHGNTSIERRITGAKTLLHIIKKRQGTYPNATAAITKAYLGIIKNYFLSLT